MKSFLCFLLLIAASTALPSDADSWIEAETSSSAHIEAQAKMESLLQAEMQTRAAEASTKLQEHLESITMNDIRDAVTSTAHETGLIHYKFAQVEIEQQVKDVNAVVQVVVNAWHESKHLLVKAAYVAGAFIADAVKKTIDKLLALLTPEVIEKGNKAIFEAATGLAEFLEMALLGGIVDFLMFVAAVNPSTTAVVATMLSIDATGATIGAIATGLKAKDLAEAAALDVFGHAFAKLGIEVNGDVARQQAEVAADLKKTTEELNLRNNLIKVLKEKDYVTPVFCAQAKAMARYILGPPAQGAAAPAPAPAPPGLTPGPTPAADTMMTIKGWGLSIGNSVMNAGKSVANAAYTAEETLRVASGKSILFVENYLPRCVEARKEYCDKMVTLMKDPNMATQCDKNEAPAKRNSITVAPKPLVTLDSACLADECPQVP